MFKKIWQTTDRNNDSVTTLEEKDNRNGKQGLLLINSYGYCKHVDVTLSTRAEESLYKLLQKRYVKRHKVTIFTMR